MRPVRLLTAEGQEVTTVEIPATSSPDLLFWIAQKRAFLRQDDYVYLEISAEVIN